MKPQQIVYLPVGVGTFHMESAREEFEKSVALLKSVDPAIVCPDRILLSAGELSAFLDSAAPGAVIFQNVTFANAAYMTETLRKTDCPVLLWTLAEPVIDGGRLRLNSLTGAYSAANAVKAFGRNLSYTFGAPESPRVKTEIAAFVKAAEIRLALRALRVAAVGHTPEGFGFGRALDTELTRVFGATLEAIEARELIDKARAYTDEECAAFLKETGEKTVGFDSTPEKNRLDHARLLKAYSEYVDKNHIGALASRCWPDFFTAFGTPVCAVLSMLTDRGVAAACEADIYGALSMWIGARASGAPAFFGDPVSLDEKENTITFWHCGAAACSLARTDTGAVIGVHPNRKIGPAMDFGCAPCERATVFRVGRKPDGTFRFSLLRGEILDKPKQFTGTSVVVKTESKCLDVVRASVLEGFEPHYAVLRGDIAETLAALGGMLDIEIRRY